MTLGSRTRGGLPLLAVLTTVALGGCHAMPLARLEDGPVKRPGTLASASRAALLPATVAMEPPSEMSSFEPVSTADARLTSAEAIASAPTPLLDAALQKARANEEPPPPEPVPPATPAEPQPLPPSALFNNPLPIELPTVNPVKPETASAEPKPAEASPTPREPEPPRPEELWRDGVRKLHNLAHAKVEQSGGSAGSPWSLRARVLAWLAEPDIDPGVSSHDLEGIRAVLRALDDLPADASRQGDAVRSAVLVLEDRAPLEIVDLRVCRGVEKFGDFEPLDPPVRKAGEALVLYSEIDGLRFEQTSGGFRTRLAGQIEIVPEGGGPAVLVKPMAIAEETCRRRRRDYYIAYKLVLPRPLPAGEYRIRLTEKDLTSDHSATREVPLFVVKD